MIFIHSFITAHASALIPISAGVGLSAYADISTSDGYIILTLLPCTLEKVILSAAGIQIVVVKYTVLLRIIKSVGSCTRLRVNLV